MVRLAVKSATSARSLVFVVEPSQATATFAAERVCRCCPEGFPTQPSVLAQSHLTSRSGSRTAPVVLDRDPTSELMPDLNLGPFVVPWARLLVRVRRLQDKVLAVTLGNDLQSAWKAGVGESGAHGCAGLTDSRSEEHTCELQSLTNLVCRLLLEKKRLGVKVSLRLSDCPVLLGLAIVA